MSISLLTSRISKIQVKPPSLTEQFLSFCEMDNPTPDDVASVNAIILSAAIHIRAHLAKNPTEFNAYAKPFTSAVELIQCADKLGWQDDEASIWRSVGYDPQGNHGGTNDKEQHS